MKALIIVDMQNDFMPSGPLGTPKADELVPIINQLMDKFEVVIATKDWHPIDHVSFAKNHPGNEVREVLNLGKVDQILWPVHCVQNTKGSEFAKGLDETKIHQIFYKGEERGVDSYSTFFDNAKDRSTGLESYLLDHKIDTLAFCGVATEYCVLYSTLDALDLGFDVTVISDACRAINLKPSDEKRALDRMQGLGAHIIASCEVM